jgi:RNA polymerase sigma-70 factor (ECF subfamily)
VNGATDARQDAFMALLERHKRILYKIVNAYAHVPSDRDDLAAEAIAALWSAYPRYDANRPFSTWMYRVALNVAISFARSERRRSDRRAAPDAFAGLDRAAPVRAEDERVERLAAIVAEFGELDKALVLLYLDGEPYRTIASIVGISETNVATKLSRLKRRIKERLERDEAVAEGDERGTR